MPRFVLEYLVMHELSHLAEPGHGPAFWALVNRYPRTERARGYLMAVGLDLEKADRPTGWPRGDFMARLWVLTAD